MKSLLTSLLLLFVLSACGGGGGGGGSSSPVPEEPPPESQQPEPAQPEPQPEPDPAPGSGPDTQEPASPMEPEPSYDSQTRSTLESLISSSNTVTDGNTIGGDEFLWEMMTQPTPASLMLNDVMRISSNQFQLYGTRNDVDMALAREGEYIDFGGWLDHSFFFVSGWNPVTGEPLDPFESSFTHVYSIGSATGSNPVSGSATWSGTMAGIDEREDAATFGNLLTGNSTVRIRNFSRPNIDITLSDIYDNLTSERHADISWTGISLSNGAFSTSNLSGQFYGPNHEEVGGVFLRNRITGAFGASRQ